MPDARGHDLITVVTAVVLAPPAYSLAALAFGPVVAPLLASWCVGAHLVSGLLFSPDLDIDSQIDNRWGPLFWIWRPYMWAIPHRNFWSHGLILPPLLRLGYFCVAVFVLLLALTWMLEQAGVVLPNYALQFATAVLLLPATHPGEMLAVAVGFITGGAAHSIADWLVTGGKHWLRRAGLRVRRDYTNHDRWR